MSKALKVGDVVMWRGGFGDQEPVPAVVTTIEINTGGSKYGTQVESAAWSAITDRDAVISLDNGHWAYGGQIKPLASEHSALCEIQRLLGGEWTADTLDEIVLVLEKAGYHIKGGVSA